MHQLRHSSMQCSCWDVSDGGGGGKLPLRWMLDGQSMSKQAEPDGATSRVHCSQTSTDLRYGGAAGVARSWFVRLSLSEMSGGSALTSGKLKRDALIDLKNFFLSESRFFPVENAYSSLFAFAINDNWADTLCPPFYKFLDPLLGLSAGRHFPCKSLWSWEISTSQCNPRNSTSANYFAVCVCVFSIPSNAALCVACNRSVHKTLTASLKKTRLCSNRVEFFQGEWGFFD